MRTAIRSPPPGRSPALPVLFRDDDPRRAVQLAVDDGRLDPCVEWNEVRLAVGEVGADPRLLRGNGFGELPDRRDIDEGVAHVLVTDPSDQRLEPAVVGE